MILLTVSPECEAIFSDISDIFLLYYIIVLLFNIKYFYSTIFVASDDLVCGEILISPGGRNGTSKGAKSVFFGRELYGCLPRAFNHRQWSMGWLKYGIIVGALWSEKWKITIFFLETYLCPSREIIFSICLLILSHLLVSPFFKVSYKDIHKCKRNDIYNTKNICSCKMLLSIIFVTFIHFYYLTMIIFIIFFSYYI